MMNYNLRELNKLSQKCKFNRASIEKVLRLAELLKLFNTNKYLNKMYVLKGGTAINLCLFDLPRLSVDIDMNFILDCSAEKMLEIRTLHRQVIRALVQQDGYTIDSKSRYSYTLDSYLLKYNDATGNIDNMKIELNYSNRILILKPVNYEIKSEIIDNKYILGMNKIELYGSKIAALIGRTTIRDVYDVFQMISNQIISDDEMDKLRKCSIFYVLNSNEFRPIDKLLDQFRLNIENITFSTIKRNLIPMLPLETNIDFNKLKSSVVEFIFSLFTITTDENQYISFFNTGKYKPELLFDESVAKNVKNHPVVLWKMMKYNEFNN